MNANTRKLSLETLEARQLMAGDAFAFEQAGTLYIIENDAGQAQDISVINHGNGAVEVVGNNGTQAFGAGSFFGVEHLDIQLGDGNDIVDIDSTDGQFATITVNLEGQDNSKRMDDDEVSLTNVDTTGNVTILTGRGNDDVTIENELYSLRSIRGDLTVETGMGADDVIMNGLRVNNDINIKTHGADKFDGNDDVDLTNVSANTIRGLLGAGADTFDANSIDVSDTLLVNAGNHNDTVNVRQSFLNTVTVFGEAGGDTVRLKDNLRLVRADINTGAGHDIVEVRDNVNPSAGVAAMELLNIDTGRGRDRVDVIGNEQIDRLFADLGRGNDTMVLESNTIDFAAIYGGDDFDTIFKKENHFTGQRWFPEFESIIENY